MPASQAGRRVAVGVLLFSLFQVLLLYLHLSDVGHLLVTIVALVAGSRIGSGRSALVLFSLGLFIAFVEFSHSFVIEERITNGHGQLTAGRRYLPDRELVGEAFLGNLVRMGGPPELGQARTVRWVTDSRGYRNTREHAEPQLIVVGDSFLAAVSSTQADSVSEQLNEDFQIATTSLSHPGNLRRYRQTLLDNQDLLDADSSPLVFVYAFEGNDFGLEEPEPWRWLTRRRKLRDSVVALYRNQLDSFGWLNELIAKLGAETPEIPVRTGQIQGRSILLFRVYDPVAERESYSAPPKVRAALYDLLEMADAIFFIPTKARVYEPWLAGQPKLPHEQWRTLREAAEEVGSAMIVDLTGPLRARASELLDQGEYVFWPDDTHWNRAGMRVAAEEAARVFERLSSEAVLRAGKSPATPRRDSDPPRPSS